MIQLIKFFLVILMIIPFTNGSHAQIMLDQQGVEKDIFKRTKTDHTQTSWYLEMQSNQPNVLQAESRFNEYFATHPKEKSRVQKRFIRWLQEARLSMDANGSFIAPQPADLEKLKAKETATNNNLKSVSTVGTWDMIGPNYGDPTTCSNTTSLTGGFCDRVYINPYNTNNLFAGFSYGGLWVSQDQGANWSLTDAEFANGTNAYANRDHYYGDIESSSITNTIAYAATEAGVLKSTTSGTSWTMCPELNRDDNPGIRPYYLALSLTDANIVLATFGRAVYRSTNGGNTWTMVFDNSGGGANQNGTNQHSISSFGIYESKYNFFGLEADYDDPNVFYLGLLNSSNQPCIYKSTNAGETFSFLVNLETETGNDLNNHVHFRTIPAQPDKFYVYDQFTAGSIYRFDEEGTMLSDTAISYYVEAGDIDWLDEDKFYYAHYGNNTLYKSTDGGLTATDMTASGCPNFVHADIRDIDAIGDLVLIGSDGGLAISTDGLTTVTGTGREISSIDLWGFSSSATSDILSAGCDHGPTKIRRFAGDNGWQRRGGADAGETSVNQSNDSWIYYNHGYGIFKTKLLPDSTFGNTEAISPDISLHRVTFHPIFYKTAYGINGTKVEVTKDNFTSFHTFYDFSQTVNRFLIAPSDTSVMYVLLSNSVIQKSIDAGTTWSTITPSNAQSAGQTNIVDIAVGDDADELWAAYGNWQTTAKVLKTTSGGSTWTNITSPNLPNTPVSQMVYQRGTDGGVYIAFAGQSGVYYRNNTLSEFKALGSGLPMLGYIQNIYAVPNKGKYRMGSSRGAYEHDLYEESTFPQASFAVASNKSKCQLTTVDFIQNSIHSSGAASYQWTFPGGTPSTSTLESPSVSYNTVGTYDVTLQVTDEFGNSNTKTLSNFIEVQTSICNVENTPGKMLDLPSNETNRPALATIPITSSAFTITCWVKLPDLQNSFAQIVSTNSPNTRFGFGFSFQGYTPNTNLIFTSPDVPYWMTSDIDLGIDEWHYVAITYTPTAVTIYVDEETPWVRNGTFQAVDFSQTSFYVNNDIHNQGGNFKGKIDELSFYDYALSQAEIREKRHLVKDPTIETGLKAYYQFNQYDQSESTLYELVGGEQSTILSSIVDPNSPLPVGTGEVARIPSVSNGIHTFADTDLSIDFPVGTTAPEGEVVVTRLDASPNVEPAASADLTSQYWIVNNYGTNISGLEADMTFTSGGFMSNANAENYHLFKRESNEVSNWSDLGGATTVSVGNNTMTFEEVASFSQFIISKNNITVPLALLSFSAELENRKVKLDWRTAIEIDHKGFNIQRSMDGATWRTIDWVDGKGDTNQGHAYHYSDTEIETGQHYFYRLEHEGFDGKISYSNIEFVLVPDQNVVSIAPNPAKDFIEISFGNHSPEKYQILLYDNLGQELQQMLLHTKASKSQKIDIANYPNSIYFISILKNGEQVAYFKFVKN